MVTSICFSDKTVHAHFFRYEHFTFFFVKCIVTKRLISHLIYVVCYNIKEQTFIFVTFPLLIVEVEVELKIVGKNKAEIEDALLVLSVNAYLNDVYRYPYY